jgi:short-subunit dehydrogenase
MFAYKGSTAMITGASKGLGAAFTKELAGRGKIGRASCRERVLHTV